MPVPALKVFTTFASFKSITETVPSPWLATTRPEAVPVNIEIPLKDIVPGRYICQINVVDEAGRKFAFPRTALVVAP